jgi:hypothetical protein
MVDGRWVMVEGSPVQAIIRISHQPSVIVHLLALLALASPAVAKPPTLDHLFPAGAARGSTVEVAASGQFERWPVRGWASSPEIAIRSGQDKGTITVEVAPGAPAGGHWIRLFDEQGASAPRPFVVGTLPEANEVEPNDEPGQAQRVDRPDLVINGRLGKNGDVDGFRVALKKGRTLVASMEANRRLGSPMDGVLQVASADGSVLAQVDDDQDRDPRIAFQAPTDGDYVVRAFAFPFVQESSIRFAGAPSFIYRLTLATGGVADHAYPLAVSPLGPSVVEAWGWNIPEAARRLAIEPPGETEGTFRPPSPCLAVGPEVRIVASPSIVEAEPNDFGHPQSVVPPVAISGRIDPPGDVDAYAFAARKGETLTFRVQSRSIGQPLDAVLRISDASGASLIEVDDAGKGFDPALRFVAPAEATYRATVRDLNAMGDPRHAYLLVAEAPRPDFALTLKADQFPINPGQTAEIAVAVERREGFAEAIEIGLVGHFDGAIVPPVRSVSPGPTAAAVTLRLATCDCARTGPIRVVGTTGDGRRKFATAPVAAPPGAIEWAWLAVPKPPAGPAK